MKNFMTRGGPTTGPFRPTKVAVFPNTTRNKRTAERTIRGALRLEKMNTTYPTAAELADYLHQKFDSQAFPANEQGGIYFPSDKPIHRLGLSLEPFIDLPGWIDEQHIDALWLHRPWKVDLSTLSPTLGILTNHLPFDETLTMGMNTRLAEALGAKKEPEELGYKQAIDEQGKLLPKRPIGMLIDVVPDEFDTWLETIKTMFGGYDRAEAGCGDACWQADSRRMAVVGAMTDELVREAADRGANLYLTGAYRKPAQAAVDETGIAVVAVGHLRTEEWGLRTLADMLRERFAIECIVHE